jgi:hypothetical protein
MSTRCQVEVKAGGFHFGSETVVLYHHCDGYPTHMLPVIAKAYKAAIAPRVYGMVTLKQDWQAGLPGRAASQIVAADADGFDIESGTELHGDIEWFYSVECVNKKCGSTWKVSVYQPVRGFWDNPVRENLKLIATGTPDALAKRAKRLEK